MMPPPTSAPRTIRSALCLVLAGICAALHIWKLPPALPALQAELGLDLVESGFLLSIVQMGGMTLGLLIGLVAERIGLRRCVMTGLAILAAASAAGTLFDTTAMMLLFRGIEGCGFLMVAMPVPSLIRRLVPPSSLSRVMGLWSCYMPAGTVIILIAGAWFLTLGDWRMLWILLGALTFVMLLVTGALVPADPAAPAAPAASAAGTRASEDASGRPPAMRMVRQTLSSRDVWMVALTFGVYAAQWIAVIGFLPTIYAAGGVAGTTAGLLTALVAGANIIGNLLAGRLLHGGVPARRLIIIGFSTMIACAFAAFGAGLPAAAQFAAILVFSAVGGLIPATLFVLAIALAPTPHTTTTTVGWMQQCSSLGQFTGPPVVAWVVNIAGGWQWTWLATGTYAIAGIALALAISRRADTRG
ncbi:MFS transporter [Castellaniella sp. GW247-6E4]|uniref:MFS transporter n=1 Tax=Castellaniella sp. GW247-6E4 TaxID=3140380 RepID=UPI0033151A00